MRKLLALALLVGGGMSARADEPGARNKTQPSPPALNLLDGLKSGQLAVQPKGPAGPSSASPSPTGPAAPSASSCPRA